MFANSETQEGGPRTAHPGSTAFLEAWGLDSGLALVWLQCSMKQGSPVGLTRGVISRYLGAKTHLLYAFSDFVASSGLVNIYVYPTFDWGQNRPTLDHLLEKGCFRGVNFTFLD